MRQRRAEWYRDRRLPWSSGTKWPEGRGNGPGVTAFVGGRGSPPPPRPLQRLAASAHERHSRANTAQHHFDGRVRRVRAPACPRVARGDLRRADGGSGGPPHRRDAGCTGGRRRIAGVGPGRSVAVLGSGLSGLLHVQLARALGATPIVATDVHPYRREAAKRLGADAALDAREDVPAADVVLVCTGAPEAIAQGLRSAARGGTVLLFGLLPPGEVLPVPLGDLCRDGVTVTSSYAGPPADMRVALDLIASGRVDVAATITHRLPLEQAAEGFRLTAEAGASLKVISARGHRAGPLRCRRRGA